MTKGDEGIAPAVAGSPGDDQDRTGLRPVQRTRIACQQIARALWKADPTLTITAMVERDEIQRLSGAASFPRFAAHLGLLASSVGNIDR